MSLRQLIFRYALFAMIATAANLATQRVILGLGDPHYLLYAAIAVGTLVGLAIKYILDKRWIFHDISTGVEANSRKFALYTAMGLITTAIFWSFETVFWMVWKTDFMRELGAIIGLAIGYVVKFNLDRRFVFTNSSLGGAV